MCILKLCKNSVLQQQGAGVELNACMYTCIHNACMCTCIYVHLDHADACSEHICIHTQRQHVCMCNV